MRQNKLHSILKAIGRDVSEVVAEIAGGVLIFALAMLMLALFMAMGSFDARRHPNPEAVACRREASILFPVARTEVTHEGSGDSIANKWDQWGRTEIYSTCMARRAAERGPDGISKGLACAIQAEMKFPVEGIGFSHGSTMDQKGAKHSTTTTHYYWDDVGRRSSYRTCMAQ